VLTSGRPPACTGAANRGAALQRRGLELRARAGHRIDHAHRRHKTRNELDERDGTGATDAQIREPAGLDALSARVRENRALILPREHGDVRLALREVRVRADRERERRLGLTRHETRIREVRPRRWRFRHGSRGSITSSTSAEGGGCVLDVATSRASLNG
jgi:hypothetical protein